MSVQPTPSPLLILKGVRSKFILHLIDQCNATNLKLFKVYELRLLKHTEGYNGKYILTFIT